MPSFDYSRIQSTATRMLARFAQGAVVLTRTTPGTPDPSTPWIPAAPTVATYTLDATVNGVSKEFVDGTTIVATDLEVTAAAFGTEPGPGDTLSIDGKVVTIVKQMRIPAAGTLVCWKWIVRG
jgi:hypothetical protein